MNLLKLTLQSPLRVDPSGINLYYNAVHGRPFILTPDHRSSFVKVPPPPFILSHANAPIYCT